MQKLIALSQHLKNAKLVKPEHFDCWAENIELEGGERHTENGLLIGHVRYTAVVSMEHCRANATYLVAQVMTWLKDYDPDRGDDQLPNPQLQVDVVDPARNISEIELNVEFKEPVYLVPDENGPIVYHGQHWGVGAFDVDVAESARVYHDADQ